MCTDWEDVGSVGDVGADGCVYGWMGKCVEEMVDPPGRYGEKDEERKMGEISFNFPV